MDLKKSYNYYQKLSVNGSMFWRSKIGEEGRHLVEGPTSNGLRVARRRQVLADSFL
jgi:hypothetical protein